MIPTPGQTKSGGKEGIEIMTTHMGQEPDRGRLVAGHLYSNEGYAILRCGNTEILIGYTLLHSLSIKLDSQDPQWADKAQLQRAIHSIAAEASLGRTGEHDQNPAQA